MARPIYAVRHVDAAVHEPTYSNRYGIIRGVYKYVRNPMYVGVLTVLAAWNILDRTGDLLSYTSAVFVLFYLLVFVYEEPNRKRLLVAEYSDYRPKVGRRLPESRPKDRY